VRRMRGMDAGAGGGCVLVPSLGIKPWIMDFKYYLECAC